MADLFDSSHRKIAWAKEHILDLDRQIKVFRESVPEAITAKADPQSKDEQPYKINFIKPIPSSLAETVSDIVDNLRAALDQTGYAAAVASGKRTPKCSAFPFAGSAAQFKNSLGRSKDIPQEICALFRAFKPYRGGNDLLWALNEICIGNKHKMLVPVMISVTGFEINATIPPNSTVYIPMTAAAWNSATNKVIVARQGSYVKVEYDIDFYISVALDQIEVIRGKPVLGVLNKLAGIVESVLVAIEAETRRLFPARF